jgi:hypothetical protein
VLLPHAGYFAELGEKDTLNFHRLFNLPVGIYSRR